MSGSAAQVVDDVARSRFEVLVDGEVALQALFERFPDLASAGTGHRRRTVVLRGYESLPVVLTPQTAAVGSPQAGPPAGAP